MGGREFVTLGGWPEEGEGRGVDGVGVGMQQLDLGPLGPCKCRSTDKCWENCQALCSLSANKLMLVIILWVMNVIHTKGDVSKLYQMCTSC